MRRFLIYYWTEGNESITEQEIIVKADNMEHALKEFKKEIKKHQSITTITELTYV
jgi:hypothetical protein